MARVLDASIAVADAFVWPLPILDNRPPVVMDATRTYDDEIAPHPGVELTYLHPTHAPAQTALRYQMPRGVPGLAAGAGVVRFAGETPRGGVVIVAHTRGGSTYYRGLSPIFVRRGETVEPGQPLGILGHSPTARLHFEVWRHGTRSSAVAPAPFLQMWPRLAYAASAEDPRNASWWAVKTPGVIREEMNITHADINALSRDIYAAFRRPWELQFENALARFKSEHSRQAGVGGTASGEDFAIVYGWMEPPPTAEDIRYKSYQGSFIHSWGDFYQAWEAFYNSHQSFTSRFWRGTYDQALDFRTRAKAWREQFRALGGAPSSPEPHVPSEGGPFGDIPWKTVLIAAGGIAAGVLVVPPIIQSLRSES